MKGFLYKTIITGLSVLATISLYLVFSEHSTLINANQLYNEGKYDDALKRYNEMLARHPDSDILNFNTGTVLYKKRDYSKAIEFFTKTLTTENPNLKSMVNYNIGNCKYRQGQQVENTDVESAASFYKEALYYYKRVMELHEKDEDARYNHELAEGKLRNILTRLKKRSGQKNGDKQGDEKKQQYPNTQHQTEPSDRQKGNDNGVARDEKSDKMEGKSPDKRSDQRIEYGQIKARTGEMSGEDAGLLLEEFRKKEQAGSMLTDKAKRGPYPEVEKDW